MIDAGTNGIVEEPFLRARQRYGAFVAIHRHSAILVTTLVLAACGSAPRTRSDSDRPTTAADSVVQFLITAAASDFHAHRPPDPARFRDVRVGHAQTSSGEEQYRLCGQFLPAQDEGKAKWTSFVTIKTSGYEQWIGPQAAGFCQDSSVTWDQTGDLSSLLQSRLDSLR